MTAARAGVALDVQATQDAESAERGIGRYIRELALALAARRSRALSNLVLNADEPIPGWLDPMLSAHRLATEETLGQEEWRAYHVGSLFDVAKRLDRVVPRAARRPDKRLIVTLYDLIPLLFPDEYLADPISRARYAARLQLLRQADCILAISEATAADAVEHAGVAPARLHVVGTGVSSLFRPPVDKRTSFAQARLRIPHLREGFILVTGAGDPRKNHRRLLDAYSRLPLTMRGEHQLVIVGRLDREQQHALQLLSARWRVRDQVLFTGFVEDAELLLLYQACELFVFPSYYEGFGLPVVEALASGAPVLAADSSSLREIVRDARGRFPPDSAGAISDRIREALVDPQRRDQLRQTDAAKRWSWSSVAERVDAAYETVLDRARVRRPRRRRIAWISSLPPQRARAATVSARVLARCPPDVLVDAYHSGSYRGRPVGTSIDLRPTRAFEYVERLLGDYDSVVYCLDGRPYSADALWLLRQRLGLVIALDLRLATLYQWRSRNRPEPDVPSFVSLCETQYGSKAAMELTRAPEPTIEDLDRLGVLMSREMLELATATLVQSVYAHDLARTEAPSAAARIEVLPWAVPQPAPRAGATERSPVITAFGWADPSRQAEKLVGALPTILRSDPATRLAIVGPIDATYRQALRVKARALGVDNALTITGAADDRSYGAWLERTTIAVQLRSVSNGESSSTVAECLARGVPTVATATGAIQELPDGTVHLIGIDTTEADIGAEICTIMCDSQRLARLTEAGLAFASDNTDDAFAELVWERALTSA